MKKSLIALAALAAVSAASAQSTVTLSGTYRFAYQKDLSASYNSATANTNVQQIGGSASTAVTAPADISVRTGQGLTQTDANLKLAAVEDLGGGMKASFDYLLESGAFRGSAFTRADSGIGLSTPMGNVDLRNTRGVDLITTIGSSAINLPDGLYDASGIVVRPTIDTLTYTAPAIMGVTTSFTYLELNDGPINLAGTNAVPANTAAYVLGAAYANGPISIRAAYKTAPSDKTASKGLTPKSNFEAAVSYDMGVAKISYAFDGAQNSGVSAATAGTANTVGTNLTAAEAQAIANMSTKAAHGVSVHVPFGAASVGIEWYKRDVQKVFAYGVKYDFSKRTSVGLAFGTKSGLTTTAGFKGQQYRLGVTHTF
jgi:hypothetical protein